MAVLMKQWLFIYTFELPVTCFLFQYISIYHLILIAFSLLPGIFSVWSTVNKEHVSLRPTLQVVNRAVDNTA